MGNGISSCSCFSVRLRRRHRRHVAEPLDEGLGHSFCYVSTNLRAEPDNGNGSSCNNSGAYSISGASLSANASTALSTSLEPSSSHSSASAFESSASFSSAPLHRGCGGDRGFLSGPIDGPPLSGPLDAHHHRPPSHSLFKKQWAQGEEQWAQGKAGEDRVHVVVSKDPDDRVFVGIYDGFNGPDATDYLLSNLYPCVQRELHSLPPHPPPDHHLEALSRALRKAEEAYFAVAEGASAENPELALMGSCILVMLMKGEDIYLMSVGDSRAVLARAPQRRRPRDDETGDSGKLTAVQLTMEHSTSVKEEVIRIRKEHPDDVSAIANNRVKGSLKVTRAFGAGFLKQPKWNDALLEMFRIDYVGTSPYITCNPYLYHHTLGPRDRFLILSSDGLYQYLTNDEAVAEVELFFATNPDGDPAQHLVEEVLFRAAKNAGMEFHELLEIPQGDRRRYHDDVSVIVISFEGRIWRSCM